MVLDLYFGPFWDKSEVMFFQKMAICEYLILAIFSRFWLFWAHFGPEMSKVYLFQLFRCKINNKIKKSGSIWLFQKLDPQSAPKSTQDPKTPLKGLRRAKIGTNASHAVQLTSLRQKNRYESNPSKVCSFHLDCITLFTSTTKTTTTTQTSRQTRTLSQKPGTRQLGHLLLKNLPSCAIIDSWYILCDRFT